jgi:hypothetical protein
MGTFEWDQNKAFQNLVKHGVTFDEASTAFTDPLSLKSPDPDHSLHEERFILIGHSYQQRLLVVVYVERADVVRIISAREATRSEKRMYEEGR